MHNDGAANEADTLRAVGAALLPLPLVANVNTSGCSACILGCAACTNTG